MKVQYVQNVQSDFTYHQNEYIHVTEMFTIGSNATINILINIDGLVRQKGYIVYFACCLVGSEH